MLTLNANIRYHLSPLSRMLILIFVWLVGLCVGYLLCDPSCFLLMRRAVVQPVSIVGLFICIFLPLVLSYYSVLFEKPICILIVCFIKSVAFGFSSALIACVYNTSSWLIRFLFLFSDTFFLLFLMMFWLKSSYGEKVSHQRSFQFGALFGILIGAADYLFVSPLLERLF